MPIVTGSVTSLLTWLLTSSITGETVVPGPPPTPLLLNLYPGATYALSTRKVNNLYSGPCMRVRRSSDNAELDIGFGADGLLDTVSLVAFVAGSDGFVRRWHDQTGNGLHAVNSGAVNQPRIALAGVVDTSNGLPTIHWPIGNTASLFLTSTLYAQPNTWFLAQRFSVGVSEDIIDGTTNRNLVDLNTGQYRMFAGTSALTGIAPNLTLSALYAIFNGASSQLKRNANASGLINPGAAGAQSMKIGNSVSAYYTGDISELIFYNSDQSANRDAILANITSYFGIT